MTDVNYGPEPVLTFEERIREFMMAGLADQREDWFLDKDTVNVGQMVVYTVAYLNIKGADYPMVVALAQEMREWWLDLGIDYQGEDIFDDDLAGWDNPDEDDGKINQRERI